ncbi:D-alanyl-D-alanine carboxypeptidase [Streptosporangium violaceochromogenes]|nr:D-alanyl-D-alanine carboxypeptidase [Streptosporangium violaceochromogenes]
MIPMRTGGIRLIVRATVAATATVLTVPALLTVPVGPAHAERPALGTAAGTAAGVAAGTAGGSARRAAPAVRARAAYVFDATTGTVHLGKQATRRMPVASLTKVMTAYVVLREARLSDVVTISAADVRHAATNDATGASLRAGERLTVRDLLYGVMLPSGADASHALARVYGPGQARFVAKMNATARSLGLTGTRYGNPDGLPTPDGGYSTARDQARLSDIALRDRVLPAIASARRHVVPKSKTHRAHVWTNTNKLLGRAPGALGVKTGYTRAAGYCLSFAADRDGHRLVGVLLGDSGSERRFQTAARLLDWAAAQVSDDTEPADDV